MGRRVKRLPLLILALFAALALPHVAQAGPCGLPDAKPLWIDHGPPDLARIFGRPGVTLALSGGDYPAKMRATGAKTVYWDMYLSRRVGTPFKPADPAQIVARADSLFTFAVKQSACRTPQIALNELAGANLETPWSTSNAQYRANVLAFVRRLAQRGARPFLLLAKNPYTAGDAADWWREVAKYSNIVPETYFSAPAVHRQGPVLGNRRMRLAMRRAVGSLTAIGIPTSKIGIVLGFQTKPGGRNGLDPASAWFRVVKWQTLAARQIAAEMRIATIWSWGWATYRADERDRDKAAAACVYLWSRDPALCDGPTAAGPAFEASRTEGQILVPAGQVCAIGSRTISARSLAALQRVTRDRDVSSTALLARLAESPHARVTAREVLQGERAVVAARFRGSRTAYRSALAAAGASVAVARTVLADELRRGKIEARMARRVPTALEVNTFYSSYPDLVVRAVRVKPAPWWLGGRQSGLALSSLAPERVFSLPTGRKMTLTGFGRRFAVTATGESQALGSVPLVQARRAIAAALSAFERRASFERWSLRRQSQLASIAVCRRDLVPDPGSVRLTAYLPFLSATGV